MSCERRWTINARRITLRMEREMVYSKAHLYNGNYKVNRQNGIPDLAIDI